MYLRQTCQNCKKTLKFPSENVGRRVRCPYCHNSLTLEAPPGTSGRLRSGGEWEQITTSQPAAGHSPGQDPDEHDPDEVHSQNVMASDTNVNQLLSLGLGVVLSLAFYVLVLPFHSTYFGELFLARGWVPFALVLLTGWSAAILLLKGRKLMRQRELMLLDMLPGELGPTIKGDNLDKFVGHIRELPAEPGESYLINRVLRGLEHYRVRKNSAEVATVLSSQSDIDSNAVQSSYTMVKVFLWAIPILGFIGTVIGISAAVGGFAGSLGQAQDMSALKESLNSVTAGLATAFDTTLVALVMSMLVMFPMSSMQKAEEDLLNSVDEYCNENLIRRLGDTGPEESTEEVSPAKAAKDAINQAMAAHAAELQAWSKKLEAVGQSLTQQVIKGWNAVCKDQAGEFTSVAEHLKAQAQVIEERARDHQTRVEAGVDRTNQQFDKLVGTVQTPLAKLAEQIEEAVRRLAGSAQQSNQQVAASVGGVTESLSAPLAQLTSRIEQSVTQLASASTAAQQQMAASQHQTAQMMGTHLSKLEEGLLSLATVLATLDGKQVVVQAPPRRGWSLFGKRNNGGN